MYAISEENEGNECVQTKRMEGTESGLDCRDGQQRRTSKPKAAAVRESETNGRLKRMD